MAYLEDQMSTTRMFIVGVYINFKGNLSRGLVHTRRQVFYWIMYSEFLEAFGNRTIVLYNGQTFPDVADHVHFRYLVYSANLRFHLCEKPLDFLLDNKEAFTLQPGHWLSCPPDRTCSSATDRLMLLGRWMGDVPHSLVCHFHCFPPVTKDTCESLFSHSSF